MCMQTFNVPTEEVSSFVLTYPKVIVSILNFFRKELLWPRENYTTLNMTSQKISF